MANSKPKTEIVEAATVPQDIMLKLMTADAATIRAAFEHATAQWKEQRDRVRADYDTGLAENDAQIVFIEKEIREFEKKIQERKSAICAIQDRIDDNRDAFTDRINTLETQRVFLDNLHNTFSEKMKGFD